MWFQYNLIESNTHAPVLLNLLNMLQKSKPKKISLFLNSFTL